MHRTRQVLHQVRLHPLAGRELLRRRLRHAAGCAERDHQLDHQPAHGRRHAGEHGRGVHRGGHLDADGDFAVPARRVEEGRKHRARPSGQHGPAADPAAVQRAVPASGDADRGRPRHHGDQGHPDRGDGPAEPAGRHDAGGDRAGAEVLHGDHQAHPPGLGAGSRVPVPPERHLPGRRDLFQLPGRRRGHRSRGLSGRRLRCHPGQRSDHGDRHAEDRPRAVPDAVRRPARHEPHDDHPPRAGGRWD